VMLFAGSVGLATTHPFGNPRTEPRKGLGTLLQHAELPADAKKVLVTKCADCHSNETRWPVYAHVAPGSWLIERDIVQARAKMNLSHWEDLSPDTRDVLIAKIIQETKAGDMPPVQYRILHWGSRLTPADLAAIRSMSKTTLGEPQATSSGDPTRGKLVFQKRCTGCHAIDGDREGPRLAGVFGRKAGSVPGFDYSAGLKHSGLTWNEATLERWLTDPDLIAPDTKMDFHVPKAQERSDLIAYFKQ
jgi:cytochrome c